MNEGREQASINEVQHLFFELFRRIRYNLLDGERVVQDLFDWHDLWYSVLPTRFPYSFNTQKDRQYRPYTELSMLRILRGESWPADTLYIWTSEKACQELRKRIEERWEASDIVVITPESDEEMHFSHIDDEHDRVLFVWWD